MNFSRVYGIRLDVMSLRPMPTYLGGNSHDTGVRLHQHALRLHLGIPENERPYSHARLSPASAGSSAHPSNFLMAAMAVQLGLQA